MVGLPEADSEWLPNNQVRHPEKRRQLKKELKPSDWPVLRAPRNLQKGDSVKNKLADGSIGDTYVIEINDSFKCEVNIPSLRFLNLKTIIPSFCFS